MSALNDDAILELTEYLKNGGTPEDKKSISFSQDALLAAYTIAYDFYRNGKYGDAKNFFRLLTVADSFERKYWMGLGACCQMLKAYEEAVDCYSVAALQDPSDLYAHWHAADCFFHLGKLDQAQEALNSALQIAQGNESHRNLIPQLSLLAETWSSLYSGVHHD